MKKEKGEEDTSVTYHYNEIPAPPESVEGIVLDLNTFGEGMISDHFGVELLFAREILAAKKADEQGNFTSIGNIRLRTEKYYLNKGYLKNSEKCKSTSSDFKIFKG